jgi:hypothetical protein
MAKSTLRLALAAAVAAALVSSSAMAIEEAAYTVVEARGAIELRDYEPRILVETTVEGDFEESGNRAFRLLFNYISGANRSQTKIEMTSPVSQEAASEKIPMTAPVSQERGPEGWRVAFLLPASYSWETAPRPTDERVSLRRIPAQRMAAIRFSGTWGWSRFAEHESTLRAFMAEQGLEATGAPEFARYNPPFTPWFLRRNEVLIPVAPISAD